MTVRYHDLNVFHDYWDPLLSGDRTFDVRLDDRGFQRGDIVVYHKLEKNSKFVRDEEYNPVHFRISWILSGGKFGIEAGHVAFSIEPTYDITSDDDGSGPLGISNREEAPLAIEKIETPLHSRN